MRPPYEEIENPERTFDVEVRYLLCKHTSVKTDDYELEHDDFERQAFINTELTDWQSAYEQSHYTIKDMLEELRRYVEKEMCETDPKSFRGRNLQKLYEDVQDWEIVESEVIEQ